MAHCFYKLGKLNKARKAFTRTLDLQPDNVGALIGIALLDLNDGDVGFNQIFPLFNLNFIKG